MTSPHQSRRPRRGALPADVVEANRAAAPAVAAADAEARALRRLAIVTCMDPRVMPTQAFGFGVGDAVVLRNAGGRVTDDVVRSLAVAVALLDVGTVLVLHHTRCAMARLDEDAIADAVREAGGDVAPETAFLTMPDPEAALAGDVERVLTSPSIAGGVSVVGAVYDLDTGVVTPVG